MNDTIVNIFIEMNDTTVKIKKKKKFYSISILVFYSIFLSFWLLNPIKHLKTSMPLLSNIYLSKIILYMISCENFDFDFWYKASTISLF